MKKQRKDDEKIKKELRSVVEKWLDIYVKKPAFETIDSAILEQAKIASLLVCANIFGTLIIQKGAVIDFDYLKSLKKEELEKRVIILSKYVAESETSVDNVKKDAEKLIADGINFKYLLLYLEREITWIAASILVASYISSLILIRSLFELVIGIATRKTGGMKDKLAAINFLSQEEKKTMKDTYDELCAWSHPYGKWIKETCPIFVSKARFHPALLNLCIRKLELIIDFMLVVATEKYHLTPKTILKEFTKHKIDISDFKLFLRRVERETLGRRIER